MGEIGQSTFRDTLALAFPFAQQNSRFRAPIWHSFDIHGNIWKNKKYLNSALPRAYNENKMVFYWNFSYYKMILTGKRVAAPELEEHHIIEKACADKEDLMAQAMAFARTFNKKRGIFGEHKRRLHKHIIKIIDEQDPEFIEPLNLMA